MVIIGGGVAGYVAAIKAGQEGMKVRRSPMDLARALYVTSRLSDTVLTLRTLRSRVSKNVAPLAEPVLMLAAFPPRLSSTTPTSTT